MSLGKALATAFNIVEPTLEHAATELLSLIFASPNPQAEIERLKRVLTTEASFAAADLLLASMLPPDPPSPPAGSEPPPSTTLRKRPP